MNPGLFLALRSTPLLNGCFILPMGYPRPAAEAFAGGGMQCAQPCWLLPAPLCIPSCSLFQIFWPGKKCWFPLRIFSSAWCCWCTMACACLTEPHLLWRWCLTSTTILLPANPYLNHLEGPFPKSVRAFQPVAPHWKCLSSSWRRTSRQGSLPLSRNLPHEILSSSHPGSKTDTLHQQKGRRMLHPGWAPGLKVKMLCKGPDPPRCGQLCIGTTHPWNMDVQGIVQMESVCSESCQQKQPWVQHLQMCPGI